MKTIVVDKRKKDFDIYIGRPTMWGNPFKIGPDGDREAVIAKYREWLLKPEQKWLRERMRIDLKGRVLGCFCAPAPCHGDVIIEVIEMEEKNDTQS